MNKQLEHYLTNSVIPKYEKFDGGHDEKHILAVVENVKHICDNINYQGNIDVPITAAYYHDCGLVVDRDSHHIHSATIVSEDEQLKNYLTDLEIELVMTAIREHRTVIEKTTLESKILADADKLDSALDIKRMFERSILYNRYKGNGKCFTEVYEHLKHKYGNGGTVKYNLIEENAEMKKVKNKLEDIEFCKMIYTDIIKQFDK